MVAAISTWAFILVLAAVGLQTWYIVDRLRSPGDSPAFEIQSIRILNPVVQPGEVVYFEMDAVRYHNCPSIIASFWMTEDGRPWTRFPPLTGGYGGVDEARTHNPYRVNFEQRAPGNNTVTGDVPVPGRYVYRSLNAPLCDNMAATETPPVSICLVVPGLPEPPCVGRMSGASMFDALEMAAGD
jgi:hypothetical protein